jgi:hypothetical protein
MELFFNFLIRFYVVHGNKSCITKYMEVKNNPMKHTIFDCGYRFDKVIKVGVCNKHPQTATNITHASTDMGSYTQ